METVNFKSHVIKYGLILGAISIILTFLIYIIDINIMIQWWFGILSIIISIAFVVYAGIDLRKNNGGFLSFKDAFLSTFLILLVAGIISTLTSLVLFHVIDPELPQRLTEASIENAAAMMQRFGSSQDQIDQAIEGIRKQDNFSPTRTLINFGVALIIYAILALIIGAIIKRKKPDFV